MGEADKVSVGSDSPAGLSKYVIDVEDVGPVSVFVEGDLEKLRVSSNIFMTVHTAGTTFQHWVNFNMQEDMQAVSQRSLFLHISLPGQLPGAPDLGTFPSLDTIALGLVNILDYLRISRVLILGDGAGANIALRFAMSHPSRVHGVVLINPNAGKGTMERWTWAKNQVLQKKPKDFQQELNTRNVDLFIKANRERAEMLPMVAARVKCEVLVITGNKTNMVEAGEAIQREVTTGKCSIIKMEDVQDPLVNTAEKLADAVVLFAQGMGLVANAKRKGSRSSSKISGGSMGQADIPNIRRLSLTAANCDRDTDNKAGNEEGIFACMVGKGGKMSMELADIPNIRRLSVAQNSHQI